MWILSRIGVGLRTIGFLALGVVALAIGLGDAPSSPTTDFDALPEPSRPGSFSSDVQDALSDARLNEILADSAPQQQVVNGWVARDLLVVLSSQADRSLEALHGMSETQSQAVEDARSIWLATSKAPVDDRPIRLLSTAALGVAWFGLTYRWRVVPRPDTGVEESAAHGIEDSSERVTSEVDSVVSPD